jgi:DNA-binding NtrC family response regulator
MPRSVLLVDDEPSFLQMLNRFFQKNGWEVEQALSGEEAVQAFASRGFDVVLLDLGLPGISGLDVLDILVSRGATVLMLTGSVQVQDAVDAMRSGAEGFLTKPVDLAHLAAAADRAAEKAELRRSNMALNERLKDRTRSGRLGSSPPMQELQRQIELLAASRDTSVLLQGESGTGKGWVAQLIHSLSPRARGPMVEINCAGLTPSLLASELFGHEKGAFTDARETKRGLFEVADRGTLFLDEIGDLSPDLQPKLLTVLETRTFRRLGGTREITVDVRLITATHRDLEKEVKAARFREDLYYRLSVFPLLIPPLRDRSAEDLLELIHRLLEDLRTSHPEAPRGVSERTLEVLVAYRWPGNVRELRNVLERALVLARGADKIEPDHLPTTVRGGGGRRPPRAGGRTLTLEEVERNHIERVLYGCDGNRTVAAEQLGIARATLHAKIKQFGLEQVGRAEAT